MPTFEKTLLSHLSTPEHVSRAWDLGLRPVVFEDPIHQDVCEFVFAYWQGNEMALVPTPEVLATEFPGYVAEAGEESLTWLVGELQKRLVRNRMQEMLLDTAEQLPGEPLAALTELSQSVHRVRDSVAPRHNRSDLRDPGPRRLRYEARAQQRGQGMTLGLPEIDAHTGGVLPGELDIVVAYTKIGKSFFLVNAAVRALLAGLRLLVCTLEQSVEEFEDRIDCYFSGVGYGRLTRGGLSLDEYRRLREAQDELAALPGCIHVEQPPRGERTVADLINRYHQLDADYLIVDQLSHVDPRPKRYRQDTTEKHAEIIFDLKDEINRPGAKIPCLMAVQFNRQAVSSSDGRPQLHQIANSADIERTVDLVLGISQSREMRLNRTMLCEVLGSRRSDLTSWLLGWHLENRTAIEMIGPYEQRIVA